MTIITFQSHIIMTLSLIYLVRGISTPAYDTVEPDYNDDTEARQICSSVNYCGMQHTKANMTTGRENDRTVRDFHEDGIYILDVCKAIMLCYLDKGNWWIHNIYSHGIPTVTSTNVCEMFDTCLALFGIPISQLSFRVILEAVPLQELNMTFPILEDDTGVPYLLPNDLGDLCPFTGYCGRNVSFSIGNSFFASCCSECSCNRDCGLTNSCCYNDLDVHKIFQCIDTINVSETNILQSTKYSMINRCLKDENSTDSWPCNDTIFLPVSSQDTHLIYVNRECALCNGETNFTKWDTALACTITSLTSSSQFLQNRKTACDYKYLPMETDMDWAKRFICEDKSVISTCSKGTSNKGVLNACQQLKAPYTEPFVFFPKTYANIYCALCNNNRSKPPDPEAACPYFGGQYGGITIKPPGFFALIDSSILDDSTINVYVDGPNSDDKCRLYTVPYATKPGCRPLLCPGGMFRTMGLCKFFAKQWFTFSSSIMVSLTPSKGTTVSTSLFTNLGQSRTKVDTWITHKCPFGNNLMSYLGYHRFSDIYMLSNETDGRIHEVIVNLFAERREDVPEVMIRKTDMCLKELWNIARDGMSNTFTARLFKYKNFVPIGNASSELLTKITQGENYNPKQNQLTYSRIRPTQIETSADVYLTKLFFCNQVEMNADEITVYDREIVIKHNGKVLGDNEYVMEQFDDDNYVVKVCFDDYMAGVNLSGADSNIMHRVHDCLLIGLFIAHAFFLPVTLF